MKVQGKRIDKLIYTIYFISVFYHLYYLPLFYSAFLFFNIYPLDVLTTYFSVVCICHFNQLNWHENQRTFDQTNNIVLMSIGQGLCKQKSTNQESLNIAAILKTLEAPPNVPHSQRQYFTFYRLNSFLLALLKIKEAVASTGITKNISCYPACGQALKSIEELDGAEVKDSILIIFCNYIQGLKAEADALREPFLHQKSTLGMAKQFSREQLGQLTNIFLSKVIQKLKANLKNAYSKKQIYGLIHFKWSNQFIKMLICHLDEQHPSLAHLENQVSRLNSSTMNKKQIQTTLQYGDMSVEQLLNCVENKRIAQLLLQEFKLLSERLSSKEQECCSYQTRITESSEIIRSQITLITKQQAQMQELREELALSKLQLQVFDKKCQLLEEELHKIDRQLKNLSESRQPSYYFNPVWEKQQLEEKYYVELIQLQSDLLLEKDQVKGLVNIVLEQIRLSHETFYDLRASKFMIHRFDHQMCRLLKAAPAFDRINLEEHLRVRQEGMESDSSPEMYKSTVSTFSELEVKSQREIILFESLQQDYKQQ